MSARREIGRWATLSGVLIILGAALAVGDSLLQSRSGRERAAMLAGGDPERGRDLMVRYGCSTCHETPGLRPSARGVGPPLGGLAQRVYVAGVLVNTPANLIAWIVDPKAIDPLTAMPVTGISEPEARDVAAFLYSLR